MSRVYIIIGVISLISSCINNYHIYVLKDGSAIVSEELYIGPEALPDTISTKDIKDDKFAIGAPENDVSAYYRTKQISNFRQYSVNNECLLLEFELKNLDSLSNYFYPNYQTAKLQPLVKYSTKSFMFSYEPPKEIKHKMFNERISSIIHFQFCFYFEKKITDIFYSKNLQVNYGEHSVSFTISADALDYSNESTFIEVKFEN